MGPDEPDSENSRTLCFALRSRDLRLLPVPRLERPPPRGGSAGHLGRGQAVRASTTLTRSHARGASVTSPAVTHVHSDSQPSGRR